MSDSGAIVDIFDGPVRATLRTEKIPNCTANGAPHYFTLRMLAPDGDDAGSAKTFFIKSGYAAVSLVLASEPSAPTVAVQIQHRVRMAESFVLETGGLDIEFERAQQGDKVDIIALGGGRIDLCNSVFKTLNVVVINATIGKVTANSFEVSASGKSVVRGFYVDERFVAKSENSTVLLEKCK